MALFEYMQQVQRLARDSKQELLDPIDLVKYINLARREVAMRSQCVRVLTPITGAITGYSVSAVGSGYTNPIVAVSAPDFPSSTMPFPNGAQALATANVENGQIAGINNVFGGAGYFQPTVVITDPTGSGATASAITEKINVINQGQEVYPFSGINLKPIAGAKSVIAIKGISIIYTNYRYSLPVYSMSTYQARVRNYPRQYMWVPSMAAQYGRGSNGSLYLYPLPSQEYQVEYDCFCLPDNLQQDEDVDLIPEPWTDSVPFMALYFVYLELQNFNIAQFYLSQFDQWMTRHSQSTQPGRWTNPYGRF